MENKVINKIAGTTTLVDEKLNAMMAYWDKDLVCRFANEAYIDWFGRAPVEMINKITLKDLLGGPDFKKTRPFIDGALQGKPQIFTRLLVVKTGELKNTVAAYYPDVQESRVRGFFAHVVDITDSRTLEIEDIVYQSESKKLRQYDDTGMITIGHGTATDSSKMREVAETLKANILHKFPGLNQLAKVHRVSVSRLRRDFKLTYNVSPYAYFRSLQMEYADYYMSNTQCSQQEIAAMLDFSDPDDFYSLYKSLKTG